MYQKANAGVPTVGNVVVSVCFIIRLAILESFRHLPPKATNLNFSICPTGGLCTCCFHLCFILRRHISSNYDIDYWVCRRGVGLPNLVRDSDVTGGPESSNSPFQSTWRHSGIVSSQAKAPRRKKPSRPASDWIGGVPMSLDKSARIRPSPKDWPPVIDRTSIINGYLLKPTSTFKKLSKQTREQKLAMWLIRHGQKIIQGGILERSLLKPLRPIKAILPSDDSHGELRDDLKFIKECGVSTACSNIHLVIPLATLVMDGVQ
jgi:hypothetical protein